MTEGGFPKFPKIPRWNRDVVLTEKIDGTNGLIAVVPPLNPKDTRETADGTPLNVEFWQGRTRPPSTKVLADGTQVAAGGRKHWLNPTSDNHEFAKWVWDHADELAKLGPGLHHGEWYGNRINRGYGLAKGDRRFALFNVAKWSDDEARPKCCEVVTVLTTCQAMELGDVLPVWVDLLTLHGSAHVPGFSNPEGIVLYHTAGNDLYKLTFDGDEAKSVQPLSNGRPLATSPDTPEGWVQQAIQEWTNKAISWPPPGSVWPKSIPTAKLDVAARQPTTPVAVTGTDQFETEVDTEPEPEAERVLVAA